MSAIAPSQYSTQHRNEPQITQLDDGDREKLQEIHDLINLMLRELPVAAQTPIQPYMASASAYFYPMLQARMAWPGLPFMFPGF